MRKAVFIDRDGVINSLVFYADTNEWESPRTPDEFQIYEFAPKALQELKDAEYLLFLVSNQPSYAKGKMSWDNVKKIEDKLSGMSLSNGSLFEKCYYCYHHPNAIIPEYAIICECRKPGTLLPRNAVKEYNLDITACFFIGDQDNDILCGKSMGFRTILVQNEHSINKSGNAEPDYIAHDIYEAAMIITGREDI